MDMRLPDSAHRSRPWRIHEIAPDFRLEDVWALPTPGGPGELDLLVEAVAARDPGQGNGRVARALWSLRSKLGDLLGLDGDGSGIGSGAPTLRDRLPEDLLATPGPRLGSLPFNPLYLTENEFAAELANRTMHGVMHLGWVEEKAGCYRGQMAVLVKPNGALAPPTWPRSGPSGTGSSTRRCWTGSSEPGWRCARGPDSFARVDLQRRIVSRQGEFMLFALTPPRLSTSPEKAQEIADVSVERLERLDLDGLILYDIDDEADRNPEKRPFPFLPTIDPADYLERHLAAWRKPVVVYRATAKYSEEQLRDWIGSQDAANRMTVFVGAASRKKRVATTLRRAQQLRAEVAPDLLLGAVAIPERHTRKGDEHLGLVAKQEAGCSYFVTQVVYDVNAAENLVSDYAYACRDRGFDPLPIVFTFSVCGSAKTLEFLRWLGVDVPRWIENDLHHADDTLDASLEHAEATALELMAFCRRLGAPFGINVESVSIRRVEIEASVRLAERLRGNLSSAATVSAPSRTQDEPGRRIEADSVSLAR